MGSLRIYDSLRKQKIPFEPLVPGKVSVYLCGPTTYDAAHIGHAYSAIMFDVVRRGLRWLGYEVTFVRNVTDVDDKIIKRANERGLDPMALSAHFAQEYRRDMALFGVEPPDIEPYVSTHIPQIIALIERLIDRGHAYQAGGDVYFAVDSFPPYGALSGQSIDELEAGARVEVDERKRAPADFALWKAAKPGEPWWESPWGRGRPGWHIECSAMTITHLGESFDLHGGGKDLVFPHHENEIAQSQGAYGVGTFARFWLHNGFLNLRGEKMARSEGNVFACPAIVAAAGPESLRMYCVQHHYRSPSNFEVKLDDDNRAVFPDLIAADRRLDYLYTTLRRIDEFLAVGKDAGDGEVVPECEALIPAVREALEDDFNAPVVVAAISDAARVANKLLDDASSAPKPVRRRSIERLGRDIRHAGSAIGLLQSAPRAFLTERRDRLARARGIDIAAVEARLAERTAARAARDFARADALRGDLAASGVEVLDTPAGVDWKVSE